jgi:metal-responsive CopG/Arc/MetJ family transcriptional regulator
MLRAKTPPRRSRAKASRRPARTRRTTLTLPEGLLKKVERLAQDRHQTLSAAVTMLIEQPLRQYEVQRENGNVWEMLRSSMAGLTEEEQLQVDGIVLEEPGE